MAEGREDNRGHLFLTRKKSPACESSEAMPGISKENKMIKCHQIESHRSFI